MLKKTALFFLILPFCLSAFSDRDVPKEKIYVQLEDLVFEPDGIWFKEQMGPVRMGTEALRVDSFGYYVEKQEQNWVCPKCAYLNRRPYPRHSCVNCGWPYD